jgi:hypothetical protein
MWQSTAAFGFRSGYCARTESWFWPGFFMNTAMLPVKNPPASGRAT